MTVLMLFMVCATLTIGAIGAWSRLDNSHQVLQRSVEKCDCSCRPYPPLSDNQ